jgi:hypothetical protein
MATLSIVWGTGAGTVATVAIVCCAPGLRRIGDDHAFWAIDFWDRRNLIVCRPFRPLLIDEISE